MTTYINTEDVEIEVTETGHRCSHCVQVFEDTQTLAAHCKREHPESKSPNFKCKECGKVFSTETYLRYHMVDGHKHQIIHRCEKCNIRFSTRAEFYVHRKNCPHNEFPCDECELRFHSNIRLRSHKYYKHETRANGNEKKRYICTFCGKVFVKRKYLEKHEDARKCENIVVNKEGGYSIAKGYKCEFCGNVYKELRILRHHRKVKHIEPVKLPCPYPECKYIGSSESLLRDHVRRIHVETDAYNCGHCGRSFKTRSNMKDHVLRIHTGKKEILRCSAPGCKRYFWKQFLLDRHVKREHSEKEGDFKCMKCERTFSEESKLQQHFSTHEGSKFYFCPKCFTVKKTENGIKNHIEECREDDPIPATRAPKLAPKPVPSILKKNDNMKYEISVDQLDADPQFDRTCLQIEAMIMYEVGEQKKTFSADEIDRTEHQLSLL